MNNRIVTADGAVITSLNPSATIAKLMEAAATPAEYDADTGQETSAKSYPAADTVYEEIDTDEVVLRAHKWLKSRYDTEEWAALRAKRDELLAACDWVVVKAQEAGEDVPAAWVTYRTALRNLPAATSDPANPTWPDAP
tara:strand:- start:2704 stop:3120 length:417 start_codon:yes stop_codon:yes gene_type:complete